MSDKQKEFSRKAEIKAFDITHRKILNFNIGKYDAAVLRELFVISTLLERILKK